ncbi:LysE family translocator [Sphingosinicella humi]|uniref:Lysine transporter LysE n=1 Tax=Allosphingosinicella humi TaxID=2068657 RepID=A0A2U2J3L9_9SPHN|nr:LysE family translocator [Sphingosinicella humi]PWG02935.1 lysine transporter LysE [Sphingosinicella humi]
MPLELWLAYVALCFLFAATPGPAVLLTAGQAIARGFRAGFGVILGTQLGNLIYFIVSAAGLGAVLIASETAFMVLKYAGAAYLVYLGLRTIWKAKDAATPDSGKRVPVWRHPFMQGLLNQLANPKSILFWGALFPQFVDFRAANLVTQFAILAITGITIDILVLSTYAVVATRGGKFMAAGPLAVWRERISGAALVVVGGALSLVKRA